MLNGRRQPSLGCTSRVNREVYARFCERLGVKFPGPTRQPAVRNFRGGDGNVGIIRSPVRAIALPDNANKPAKEFDSKSLALRIRVKHFGRFI
jgi:hypothetical protein